MQRLDRRASRGKAVAGALATTAIGAGISLPVIGRDEPGFVVLAWLVVVLLLVAVVFGVDSWQSAQRYTYLLTCRGTAYVVDSPAQDWHPELKDAFLQGARSEFADVVNVPGPTGLTTWGWPRDNRAKQWSAAVDDLVLSSRTIWANDDPATPNSVVCWAWWAVAMAWASRLSVADRGLKLSIRQRPSRGGEGRIDVPDWAQTDHTFATVTSIGLALGTVCSPRAAVLHLHDAPSPIATESVDPAAPVDSARMAIAAGAPVPVRVLLVRMTHQEWSDLTPTDDSGPVEVHLDNRSGQPWAAGESRVEFHEWRCLRPPGAMHAWQTYPQLVHEITEWIADTADPHGLNFLGMLVPQEVGLGIGIHVARRSPSQWPTQLWPIIPPTIKHPTLLVPGLSLDWTSMHQVYLDGPR